MLRPPAALLIFLGLVATAAPAGSASMPHIIYGLDPHFRYEVSFGSEPILEDVVPSPAGGVHFVSEGARTVHIAAPKRDAVEVIHHSCNPSAALQGPFPNPIRDRAEFIITSPTIGTARLRLYDLTAGRTSYEIAAPLTSGPNSLWIEIPSRIPSGLYLLRVEMQQATLTRKIVLIRH